jgi:hypothetical protein
MYTKLPGTSDVIYLNKSNRPHYINRPPTTWTLRIKCSAADCPAHVLLALRLFPNNTTAISAISPAISPKTQSKQYERHQRSRSNWDRRHALARVSTPSSPSSPPSPRRIHRQSCDAPTSGLNAICDLTGWLCRVRAPGCPRRGGCAVSRSQPIPARRDALPQVSTSSRPGGAP